MGKKHGFTKTKPLAKSDSVAHALLSKSNVGKKSINVRNTKSHRFKEVPENKLSKICNKTDNSCKKKIRKTTINLFLIKRI